MSKLNFNINATEIASAFGELKEQLEADLTLSVKALSSSTYARVAELASENLKSSRQRYIEALDWKEIADGVWVVTLDMSKAGFIEDGMEAHDMHDTHLKKNFKISKEGFRYKSIPFDHSQPPSNMTDKHKEIVKTLKEALKKERIPFKGIEKNADGSPRVGKLHSLNIASQRPSLNATHPALHGVSIYQTPNKNGGVNRSIMTFRTISDNPDSQGKWMHPGIEARHFFEKAYEQAVQEWENEIFPELMRKYDK